jgi:hypothetical protein
VDISGTSAVALALLVLTALLLVAAVTNIRPAAVPPPAPRGEVKGESRSHPAPGRERRRFERATPRAEQVAPPEAAPAAAPAPAAEAVESPVAIVPEAGGMAAPRGVAAPSAEELVTSYYEALDDRRFATAWKALSPAVREAFGGFEGWRAGYETTLSSRPSDIVVSPDGKTVELVLTAVDRSPCGEIRRRFAVTWKLLRVDGTWVAESLSAVKRSGPEPAEACA